MAKSLDDLAREQGLTGPPPALAALVDAMLPTEADAEEFRTALARLRGTVADQRRCIACDKTPVVGRGMCGPCLLETQLS